MTGLERQYPTSAWPRILPRRPSHWRTPWHVGVSLLLIATAILLGWLYVETQHEIYLEINGVLFRYRTHQKSATSALDEIGLPLYAGDSVELPDEEALLKGEPIALELAPEVRVVHDGSVTSAYARVLTVGEALEELGVIVREHDELLLNDRPVTYETTLSSMGVSEGDAAQNARSFMQAVRSPVQIDVRRAVSMQVQDGQIPLTLHTTAGTVGQALFEQGIVVRAGDRVFPDLDTGITPGLQVFIQRAKPIVLRADGYRRMLYTRVDTVGQALEEYGIALGAKDYVMPESDTVLSRDAEIDVVRVYDEYYIEEQPIAFETVWEPNPEMEIDTQRVVQWGSEGAWRRKVRVHYENGEEVRRAEEDAWVAREPENRVTEYGTKIVLRELETPSGTVTYWRKLRMLATSYNAATAGKSADHPTYGITRLGWEARKGIIAVDPRVIQLRQELYVPGYGQGIAGDTGSAITWRHIDLCFDDDNLELWRRWVDVYVLTPVPARSEIKWIIPNTPVEKEG